MKLRVEPLATPQRFSDFCDQHRLQPVARERSRQDILRRAGYELSRWYVSIPNLEIREDGVLVSTFGNGDTPEEALAAYARRLAGHRLVVDASRLSRREFLAPNEWLPEEGS